MSKGEESEEGVHATLLSDTFLDTSNPPKKDEGFHLFHQNKKRRKSGGKMSRLKYDVQNTLP